MKSKVPLWKKSCLAAGLSWENMTEWLDEIGDSGDPYGYEDESKSGYYNDYKELFDDLSAGAYSMYEVLTDYDIDSLREIWDDMTVALLGDLFTVYGYDTVECDYYRLRDGFEEDRAVSEAEKRLMRFTKQELIRNFRRVLKTIVMFLDLKCSHDCLTAVVEELDERGALLERKNERINALYTDLTGKSGEQFDEELRNLPPRMWVE